jgi:Zn finger protein HypA/HybF involved in hydrogenase expression
MPLIDCYRCGKVFTSEKLGQLCPDCLLKENEELKTVSNYLRKYPLATIMEVTAETEVPVLSVLRFVRQGALRMTQAPADLKCRLCGVDVSKGTLCQKCREKILRLNEMDKKRGR